MVGGGQGAFSTDPGRATAAAAALGIAPARCHDAFRAMATAEVAHPVGAEVVTIVTLSHRRHAAARAFLDVGIHVVCDRPVRTTLAEAHGLEAEVRRIGPVSAVTYTNAGYDEVSCKRTAVQFGIRHTMLPRGGAT